MQIAQQDGSQVSWLSTSPATGSEYPMDNARYVGRKELDPLGADVTTQPDPAPVEPPFYNPKFDQMPIQYEGGPSEEYLQANADWDATIAFTQENIRQANEAQELWQNGDRSGAEAILNNNPNVGIEASDGSSYFGKDAADFLDAHPNATTGSNSGSGRAFAHAQKSQNSRDHTDLSPAQLERFKTCLKAYNVEYKGHEFRLPGTNSSDDNSYFYGHTERGAHWYSVSAIGDFTIRTDQHSYSVSDIERTKDRFNVGFGAGYLAVGFTDPKSPYVNAIAHDYGMMRLNPNQVLRLWVYELGNALSFVTRTNPALPADVRARHEGLAEPGAALEDCVFNPK